MEPMLQISISGKGYESLHSKTRGEPFPGISQFVPIFTLSSPPIRSYIVVPVSALCCYVRPKRTV